MKTEIDRNEQNERVRAWISLPSERVRLVNLCASLVGGDRDVAEDLAQETLLEAWRHASGLRDETARRAWLSGIARNVCRRWHRRSGRERERTETPPLGLDELPAPDALPPDMGLERTEVADLLSRAMGALPQTTRQILVERYVEDLPPSEIAARLGVTENTATVRLHRGRLALRKVLSTQLRADAAPYGLLDPDAEAGWQETRIWCPRCGVKMMQIRITSDVAFHGRCPDCGPALGMDFTSRHRAFDVAKTLGDAKTFRPALRRVHGWWNGFYRSALSERVAPCMHCGHPADVLIDPPDDVSPFFKLLRGMYVRCGRCARVSCVTPSGLALMLPETQQFWQRHPRMRLLPQREIRLENGRSAVVVRMESLTDRGGIEIVAARDSFEVLEIREE